MADENLICPICGEPTNVYFGNARKDRLCSKHGKMANAGTIFLDQHGRWREAATKNLLTQTTFEALEQRVEPQTAMTGDTTCVVCGNPSNGKMQCKNCYSETVDFMDSLDKNKTVRQFRDHYYNLKERILIIKSLEEAQKQCNKLIAIAMVDTNLRDDTSLYDRVYKDVEALLKSKKAPIANDKYEEERKENDEQKSKVKTAQDGHVVDSDMEVHIDDVLYNAYILHCYGKSVEEITEKRKKCDWFIPIVNDEGIYIEYWGMKTPKYLAERKEKEELYQKYNIPYISIEADDPKQDTQTFKSNLIRDLTKLATERFGFMPKWKR